MIRTKYEMAQIFPIDANLSINEFMVPYYGRHSGKQHIHGKPIRFGFKVWSMCTRLGYLVYGIPYQGASTGNTMPHLGVGGSVVMTLVSKLPKDKTYSIFIDNFCTSVKLLEEIRMLGHNCTGRIRNDQVEKLPLIDVAVMKRMDMRLFDQITDKASGVTLVRYNDNNVVTIASIEDGAHPLGKVKCWCNHEKKRIMIAQSACGNKYNTYMGGVDKLDENVATYRPGVRSKEWYWQMILFPIRASVNNAYQLYRLTPNGKSVLMISYIFYSTLFKPTFQRKAGEKCFEIFHTA